MPAEPAGRPGAAAHRSDRAAAVRNSSSSSNCSRAAGRRPPRRSAAAPPPQPPYTPPQPQAYPPPQQQGYPRADRPIRPQQHAYPPAPPARRRTPRRCVRSEPESERARRAAHARRRQPSRPRRRLTIRRATRSLTSARPAAGRPARRSISASWRRKPQTARRRAREVRQIPGALPPPPPRNPSGTGAQQMVMAPTNTPKDEYDLAYGYVLRKDYALAEDSLRAFMKKYPGDRLAADADYWLGETMFQRQNYREAAEAFLDSLDQARKSAQGAGLAAAARPVARRAEGKGSRLRDARRDPAQISARRREREAVGRARAEARRLPLGCPPPSVITASPARAGDDADDVVRDSDPISEDEAAVLFAVFAPEPGDSCSRCRAARTRPR